MLGTKSTLCVCFISETEEEESLEERKVSEEQISIVYQLQQQKYTHSSKEVTRGKTNKQLSINYHKSVELEVHTS